MMVKMSVFNKTNDVLIVDTFKNVFQRRSSEVFKPDVPEYGTIHKYMHHCQCSVASTVLYMFVGPVQKVDKSLSSKSGQFYTGLSLPHRGMKRDYCGRICQQLDRLHEACCLQHCSRYPAIVQGKIWKYKV